jgi:hypothetical protein
MWDYEATARAARGYGDGFVDRAWTVAAQLGMPSVWLLAIIAWETGDYRASGPPWTARNAKDNGGGIIGFTGVDGGSWENMTPTEQLDLLIPYFGKWKREFGISSFRSPIEAYWIVTAPWGLLMGPNGNVGGGRTRQWIVDTMKSVFRARGILWSEPSVGVEGRWSVRIGNWLGQFVFLSDGDVWYSSASQFQLSGQALAEPEVGYEQRTYGHWTFTHSDINWRFGPRDDVRRFELSLPAPTERWEGIIRPAGQGYFKMWRGSFSAEPS